jgi:drug/metabolite transporter (DMT)-like permease
LDVSREPWQFSFDSPLLDSGIARLSTEATATTLALISALGLGAGFVLTQFALQWMPPRLGAVYSIPASTVLFWCMAPFTIEIARFDAPAAILFACAGVLFPATVALLNFESNRLMGPNIAASVGGLTPVFAVAFALIVIGESLRMESALGIAAITTGVTLLALANQRAAAAWSSWMLVLPLGAAAIRGAIQPLIKFGLVRWPDARHRIYRIFQRAHGGNVGEQRDRQASLPSARRLLVDSGWFVQWAGRLMHVCGSTTRTSDSGRTTNLYLSAGHFGA